MSTNNYGRCSVLLQHISARPLGLLHTIVLHNSLKYRYRNVTSISTQFTNEQIHNRNVMFSLILEHDLMR